MARQNDFYSKYDTNALSEFLRAHAKNRTLLETLYHSGHLDTMHVEKRDDEMIDRLKQEARNGSPINSNSTFYNKEAALYSISQFMERQSYQIAKWCKNKDQEDMSFYADMNRVIGRGYDLTESEKYSKQVVFVLHKPVHPSEQKPFEIVTGYPSLSRPDLRIETGFHPDSRSADVIVKDPRMSVIEKLQTFAKSELFMDYVQVADDKMSLRVSFMDGPDPLHYFEGAPDAPENGVFMGYIAENGDTTFAINRPGQEPDFVSREEMEKICIDIVDSVDYISDYYKQIMEYEKSRGNPDLSQDINHDLSHDIQEKDTFRNYDDYFR